VKTSQSRKECLAVLRRGGVIYVDYEPDESLVPPFDDLALKSAGTHQLRCGGHRVYWQVNTSLIAGVFNIVSLMVKGAVKNSLSKTKDN